MEEPTTPGTRRALWGGDALRLVEDLQRYAQGEGRESFPPWRIGYMSGLRDVKDRGSDGYSARIHRQEPHRDCEILIPKQGRPGSALLDKLAWHLDQDVRRYELDDCDLTDPWHRLPSGPLLVDPLFATALSDAHVDERRLCALIADARDFGIRRVVEISLGERTTISWPNVAIRMNEVHVRFKLPGTLTTYWSNGHLVVDVQDIPETIAVSAKGRMLSELVEHEMIARSAPITVAAITRAPDGTYSIATDAARGDGMVGVPRKSNALAA